ncbi:MAG: metallophosphoesterase [Phycisphaerales bacterium]|nr:metallophosphoesterase [Phycisphaerales bacterium]MCI0631549.1 metallophosphoesterase [Phycisphaerales bacterium]MCI0676290.1 metallophosphoesterase [Phycisphaerales bacterium]
MATRVTRRQAMQVAGLTAAGLALGGSPALAQTPPTRRRVLRLAHLTDIHVQPELNGNAGLIKCLHHVQGLEDRPSLILTGGDLIYDSFEADDARAQLLWGLFRKILADECSLPVEHCVGNHDIWGWNKIRSGATGNEPNFGKQRALDNLGLAMPYRSFDLPGAGWRCIVLDSTFPDPTGYKARLDEPQFDWLTRELQNLDPATPVLIISHMPIICGCIFFSLSAPPEQDWPISGARVHLDAIRLKDLFKAHPNVKLCLSGHIHLIDRVDYNGVTYLCNGAVCGAWWKGRHKECDEGYAVIDLFDDGTFEHQYIKYGWRAAPS